MPDIEYPLQDVWLDRPTERGWYESIHYPVGQGYQPYFVRLDGRIFEYSPYERLSLDITDRLREFAPFRRVKNIHVRST